MAMWRLPADVRIEREPDLHAVVDGITERLAVAGREANPKPGTGAAPVDSAARGRIAESSFSARTSAPFISHGNFCGGGWTAGRRMRPGELMGNDDLRVQPVDSLDERCSRHDFGYDLGLRDMRHALADGYSNADALVNFHYRAIDADREFGEDAGRDETAPSFIGAHMWKRSQGFARGWIEDRKRMIEELQVNAIYRAYVNRLKPEQLYELTMPRAVGHELNRIDAERAARAPYWWLRGVAPPRGY